MQCVVLFSVVGMAAAFSSGGGGDITERVTGLLNSPVVQRITSELGITLPELPDLSALQQQVMSNVDEFDINALLTNVTASGCLPDGFALDDASRDVVNSCIVSGYNNVTTNPLSVLRQCPGLAPPTRRPSRGRWGGRRTSSGRFGRRRGGRFGRSIRGVMMSRAKSCILKVVQSCVVADLGLVTDGELSQTSVDALIDSTTAPDEFKARMKQLADACVAQTPAELSGEARLLFQQGCISRVGGLDCALGVARGVSPVLELMARRAAGSCFARSVEPPPRAVMAMAKCSADQLSAFLEERLNAAAAARRRRRDIDPARLLSSLRSLVSLERVERILGVVPSQPPCRSTFFRRCPPPVETDLSALNETLDAAVARAETYLGPLDQLLPAIPEMYDTAANCWYTTMGAVNADGTVNFEAFRAIVAEFDGDAAALSAGTQVVDACVSQSSSGLVAEFQQCLDSSAAFACPMLEMGAFANATTTAAF